MSGTYRSPTANTRSPPGSPTYAQALMSTSRPAPINTNIGYGNGVNKFGTLPTSTTSAGDKSVRAPTTSLYPPSIWSPIIDVTQSASMPNKLSWEQSLAKGSVKQRPAFATPLESQYNATSQPATTVGLGLGVDAASDTSLHGHSSPHHEAFCSLLNPAYDTPTAYQLQQNDIFNAKTSPYRRETADPTANTYPLSQNPFGSSRELANQPRIASKGLRSPVASSLYNVPIGSERKASLNRDQTPTAASPDHNTTVLHATSDTLKRPDSALDSRYEIGPHASVPSELSELPSRKDEPPTIEVLVQSPHAKSVDRYTKHTNMPSNLDSAFPEAFIALKVVNNDSFELPSNARVICIKTEYVNNIHWAIKRGAWCAMEKVGQRIMRVWEECQKDGAPVFLLMSINGQKSYCGLAEMTGDFKMGGDFIGWIFNGDRANQWGSFPLRWHYIKTVSYSWFADIHHSHNNGPIINMWNGMHFPNKVGTEVVSRYVGRPHFTNILCWEKKGTYFPLKGNTQPEQIDPTLGPIRGAKGGRGVKGAPPQLLLEAAGGINKKCDDTAEQTSANASASPSPTTPAQEAPITSILVQTTPAQTTNSSTGLPIALLNGIQAQHQPTRASDDFESGATKTSHRRNDALTVDTVTPPAAVDGAKYPSPKPGELVTCVVDANGNYVPITCGNHQAKTSAFSIPSTGTPQTVVNRRNIFKLPTTKLYNAASPTPIGAHDRGSHHGHIGTPSNLGNVYSPASSVRSKNSTGSILSQVHHARPTSPAVRRMQSDTGFQDTFAQQHLLRPTSSNPSIGAPQYASVFQQQPPPNKFIPHPSPFSPLQGLGNGITSGISVPTISTPTPTTFPMSRISPFSGVNQHSANRMQNSNMILPGLGMVPPTRATKAPSHNGRSVFSFPSNAYGSGSGSTENSETKFTRACLEKVVHARINASNQLAQMNYRKDSRRTRHLAESEHFQGSEPGGLHCWVSDSSIANKHISPVPSLGATAWGSEHEVFGEEMGELEKRTIRDVELLCASPELSTARVNPGGVGPEFGGEGFGGVRL